MSGPQPPRLVGAVLRCYPRQWRRRRGEEAAELAVLLLRDGIPARSIAWSYLGGAARERLTAKPGQRIAAAAAALLAAAGALVAPLGLLSAPASAASQVHQYATNQAHQHAASQADPAARLAAQLSCGTLHRQTVRTAWPALERWHVTIVWAAPGRAASRALPPGSYYLAGGHRLAPDVISIRVTPRQPAGESTAGGHGQPC
jgi:hypothetical protein